MTTRTDLIADRLRLRTRAHDGITWAADWDEMPDTEREFWRRQVRDVIADIHHASHDAPCEQWPYFTGARHGADHDTRAGHPARETRKENP